MKKATLVLLVLVLSAVMVLGAKAQEQHEPVVLTMVTHETEALDAAFWQDAIAVVLQDLPDYIQVEWSSTADRDAYAKQLAATGQFPDIPFAVTVADFADAGLLMPFDEDYLQANFILPHAADVKKSCLRAELMR